MLGEVRAWIKLRTAEKTKEDYKQRSGQIWVLGKFYKDLCLAVIARGKTLSPERRNEEILVRLEGGLSWGCESVKERKGQVPEKFRR